MPTECSRNLFGFAPFEGREVSRRFAGAAITSDAGALLLGATDRAIGMMKRFAAYFGAAGAFDRAWDGDPGRPTRVPGCARLR
jgi:hypothetical protein